VGSRDSFVKSLFRSCARDLAPGDGARLFVLAPGVLNILVPELSQFFGIVIRMFAEVGAEHHVPHFHAYYQEEVGIYSIDPVEMIAGSLPSR